MCDLTNLQLTGCIAAVLVLITLLWIGPLFEKLPTAALAAIIMVNLKNLLKQFNKVSKLKIHSAHVSRSYKYNYFRPMY